MKTAVAQPLSMGKAYTVKKTFSRETLVSIDINAGPQVIWELLTNATEYPSWNSTIVSIEGEIEQGNKIQLKSTLDPKRTFKLKVKQLDPLKTLVWGDAMGERRYSLSSGGKDTTTFSMTEKIGGPIFPLFAKLIPSFDESFEQFARDLKRQAENSN